MMSPLTVNIAWAYFSGPDVSPGFENSRPKNITVVASGPTVNSSTYLVDACYAFLGLSSRSAQR